MNRLMMMLGGALPRYMEGEGGAGGEGGGAGASPTPTPAPASGGEGSAPAPVPAAPAKGGEGGGAGDPPKGAAKPFLGEEEGGAGGKGGKPAEGNPPAAPEVTEQSFIEGMKADEKQFGQGAKLDEGLIKALAPSLKESGISVEQANKIANEIAKYQVEQAKEAYRSRVDYFNKMKDESMKKYTPADFKTINAGINACFKKGGVMNHVIRNSELGADPEFLALMLEVGKRSVQDGGEGGATGGGASAVDPNGIEGLAKMW